eukprot:6135103-Pyramimonas_sp.AAC.1
MSRGTAPDTQHDGSAWPDGRAARGATALGYKAMLLYIKGDWGEHCHTLGITSYLNKHSPCQFCCLAKSELY